MSKCTEDDTFNRLKRSKFETVLVEITHSFDTHLATNTDYNPVCIIEKHGWTEQEYLHTLLNLYDPEQS
jgi:hypothetical protein